MTDTIADAGPVPSAAPPAKPPKPIQRRGLELEFLPAAQEIQETPAPRAAQLITLSICVFFALAVAWSWIGTLDIVALGDGKLVPSGNVKVIQPAETGVVKAIHVRDGQIVKAGELLIALDPTLTAADRDRLATDLRTAEANAARLRAYLDSHDLASARAAFSAPATVPEDLANLQRRLLLGQVAERSARLQAVRDEKVRREAERQSINASVRRLERALPLLRQRVAARGELADKGFGSRLTSLEVQQQLVETEEELNVQRHRMSENAATIAALESERLRIEAEYMRTALAELNDWEAKGASYNQELIKAQQRLGQQELRAPVDGVIQQLAVHTIGGVVTPAQPLMVVVPLDTSIEVEAFLANKDIGHVREGQHAEIKLETFPFTTFGSIPGTVTSVSRDAIADEKRGLIYAVRARLDKTTMRVDGKDVPLTPGMKSTVEIKTGDRQLLDYLLAPLLRYKDESFRER